MSSSQHTPPCLCLIAARAAFESDAAWLGALARVARAVAALAPGAPQLALFVQVRLEKPVSSAIALPLASEALHRWRDADPAGRSPILLNAAISGEEAAALGYDGVHWREDRIPDLAPTPPRSIWTCSASVHSAAALRRAQNAGARFAIFGPIWSPAWKASQPVGLQALGRLVRSARVPVVAIGGITPERTSDCLSQGAGGVAVVSGVFHAADPGAALGAYIRALESGRRRSREGD